METVYRERANGRWEYWTYCDGNRVLIPKSTADHIISQGGKLVNV